MMQRSPDSADPQFVLKKGWIRIRQDDVDKGKEEEKEGFQIQEGIFLYTQTKWQNGYKGENICLGQQ